MGEDIEDLGVVGPLPQFGRTDAQDSLMPALLVALPDRLGDYSTSLPVGALLDEWSFGLNPVASLREIAQHELIEGEYDQYEIDELTWRITDSVVRQPSPAVLGWLREVAKDEGVVGAFKQSRSMIVDSTRPADELQLRRLVTFDTDATSDVLSEMALPVLVGLATIAAVSRPIGSAGRATYASTIGASEPERDPQTPRSKR
jgi:hypothetical protein